MFGYIAPRMDLLNEEQRIRYRAVYCGLCHEIANQSGQEGRLLLSHDMTFLALLLQSLTEAAETPQRIRCLIHPAHKREIFKSEPIAYAASMNLILMDFKFQDQIRDDRSRMGRIGHLKLESVMEKMESEYPDQLHGVRDSLAQLWEEEQKPDPNPDRMCNLSGDMLKSVFAPPWIDPYWKTALEGMGFGLGSFVYWMDAWDDLKKDLRKGHVNPLIRWKDQADLQAFVKDVLELFLGESVNCFEALPLEKDLELLRNVMYSGVWQRFDAIEQYREKKERKKP